MMKCRGSSVKYFISFAGARGSGSKVLVPINVCLSSKPTWKLSEMSLFMTLTLPMSLLLMLIFWGIDWRENNVCPSSGVRVWLKDRAKSCSKAVSSGNERDLACKNTDKVLFKQMPCVVCCCKLNNTQDYDEHC